MILQNIIICYKQGCNNKHLMTGSFENGEFCFTETLNVLRGEESRAQLICHGFKVHDLIMYESKVQVVVPPKLVSFVGSRGFDPREVTGSPPIRKHDKS